MLFAIDSFGLSQRRACKIVPLSCNTLRYKPKKKDDEALRKRMRELAEQRRRAGCKMLHAILRREGLVINHKRTERIYREEGLALAIRRRKKRASVMRIELNKPTRPNEQWAMDFVSDSLANGRRIRVLTVIDIYTREALKTVVDTSIGGERVTRELNELHFKRGLPEVIVVDNGPEFVSNALDEWAFNRGVKINFITPGKPIENAFIESFNGRLREECLNVHWFMSMNHARRAIEEWRVDYNTERPHSSLNDLTPEEFMQKETEKMKTDEVLNYT